MLDALRDTFQAGPERWSIRDPVIQGDAVNIAFMFGAAGAKIIAEEKVTNASDAKHRLERFAIEL